MTSVNIQDDSTRTDVLILGAGFSGLAAAAMISRAGGFEYLILEQADDVGGTWRENTYPGCACDIPSPLYSFSFRQNPDWRHLFAPQNEILDYLRDTSAELRITERIRFGTTVTGADWDEEDGSWVVHAAGGSVFRARFLVSAMGVLHHANYPSLPGIEDFQGPVFHSAHWDHSVDLDGKRVAVVGTGASAIQFVPAIVDRTSQLAVFQRTAPWIVPKFNRAFGEDEREEMRRNPIKRWYRRARLFWIHEKRARGFVSDASKMGPTRELAEAHRAKQIRDHELRKKLTPDYAIGCKRLLISSDYYPALAKPHVDVVTTGIEEVRAHSILATDGSEYDADVLIFGTGFDAQNSLTRVPIHGRDGAALGSQWASGPEAYLGTTVSGFPNLFLLCGPNTGLGHNSQVFMIEAQVRYMIRCLRYAGRDGLLEVRRDAQERFNRFLQGRLSSTVWQAGGCKSWYQDPVTGRNTLLWPRSTLSYWFRTRFIRRSDYQRKRRPAFAGSTASIS
ncbi:NAD(P)/FAD-dependent oxidoreductase [Prescottella soli]|uniref:NAD(P)/FAD-dependent oxidoreductase n=1 Tax=Prescottella soli TaxID=1543852 RepID=A0ABW9FTJ1_9NOCA